MPLPPFALSQVLSAAAMAALLAAPAPALAKKTDKTEKARKAEPEAATKKHKRKHAARAAAPLRDGDAERRLLEISQLTAQGRAREALPLAERLVRDHPNFQLAQLALGDLLAARARPLGRVGDVVPAPAVAMQAPPAMAGLKFATAVAAPAPQPVAAAPVLSATAAETLSGLRSELRLRLDSTKAPPPQGSIPAQFLELSARTRHAIAMDASRSRLYLFENTDKGLVLVADYYASVGKLGTEKLSEGDQRTPLGVYYITSRLDPATLKDFYGAGALPINYPNPLDQSRGKTGSGIWLHGTPPEQFSRAPQATDGCLALANPDLERLLKTVEPRTTPVVIARQLQWVKPQALQADRQSFHAVLEAWRAAKSHGDMQRLLAFYAPEFQGLRSAGLEQWAQTLHAETKALHGRSVQLKDKSMLRWTDSSDTMVVTFGEVAEGARSGSIKRQYWTRKGARWQIFFEGVIG
ncbi:MAG: L,D-transpeptidase family protein [Proteobacteria bacterium]|nr:L,D-transpeptidase family protein [Pseudomonadota bacterium]